MVESKERSTVTIEKVPVPRDALISHVIAHAMKADDWDAMFPEGWIDPWHDFDLVRDSHSYNVDILDSDTVVVSGDISTTYGRQVRSARYNPPGKAHLTEHENIDCEGYFSIEMVLEDLGDIVDVQMEIWES